MCYCYVLIRQVMVDMNVVPSLVMLGIFAATFFSSMSNMIGASRVLNRLAQDKLFGMLLQPATVEYGKSGNPVVSVIISWSCVVVKFIYFIHVCRGAAQRRRTKMKKNSENCEL